MHFELTRYHLVVTFLVVLQRCVVLSDKGTGSVTLCMSVSVYVHIGENSDDATYPDDSDSDEDWNAPDEKVSIFCIIWHR